MRTIVKLSTAQDFLAIVPRLVGFVPEESVVFVAFRGKRSIGALRFELPRSSDVEVYARTATTLVGVLSRLPGVEAVMPVVYTAAPFGAVGRPPFAEFLDTAVARFDFSGIDVRDALCVAGDGWGSYFDDACPPGGRSLDLIAASTVDEEIPLEHRGRLGTVEEWTRLPEVDLATKERVARRIRTLAEILGWLRAEHAAGTPVPLRGGGHGGRPLSDAEIEAVLDAYVLDDLPFFVEEGVLCDPDAVPDRAAAMLIHLAQSPALRDVILMQWAFDRQTGDAVLDDVTRFAAGEPADALPTGRLMLGEGPRPDVARTERSQRLAKALAARAPRAQRPPLLCMLAWLYWALGRSSVAGRFVDEAVAIDPDYGLAEVLGTMLQRGMLPEWAFADPGAGDDE